MRERHCNLFKNSLYSIPYWQSMWCIHDSQYIHPTLPRRLIRKGSSSVRTGFETLIKKSHLFVILHTDIVSARVLLDETTLDQMLPTPSCPFSMFVQGTSLNFIWLQLCLCKYTDINIHTCLCTLYTYQFIHLCLILIYSQNQII